MSCICISLFACETAFGIQRNIPQFLPSPRQALDVLVHQKEVALREEATRAAFGSRSGSSSPKYYIRPHSRSHSSSGSSLSIIYSLAENAILEELVEVLETILGAARKLYGISVWTDDRGSSVYENDWMVGGWSDGTTTAYGSNSASPTVRSPTQSVRNLTLTGSPV